MSDGRVERILGLLREATGRVTAARRALVLALLGGSHHLTAEDLLAAVRAQHPDVAPSTVYRTLETLERLGVVEHSHLGHGPAVYHLADESHHHLVCESCGSVVEVADDVLAGVTQKVEGLYSFRLGPHFALTGRCRDCSSAPGLQLSGPKGGDEAEAGRRPGAG